MRLLPTSPIQWNRGAARGAHHLPTDHAVEVAPFDHRLSPGWSDPKYRFGGGVAQALHGIEVLVEQGGSTPAADVLAGIGRQLAELPASMTGRMRQIVVYKGQDDAYDRYYERAYGIPGFRAAAAGGNGQITFFGGRPYTDGTLFHEFGHNLALAGSWSDAVRADDATVAALARTGSLRVAEFEPVPDPARRARWTPRLTPGGVTPYGHDQLVRGSGVEDVPEALRLLLSERHFGHAFAQVVAADGTVRALRFAEAYPARTRLLERSAGADLDGDGAIG